MKSLKYLIFFLIWAQKEVSSEIIDCVFTKNNTKSIELICDNANQAIYTDDCFGSVFGSDEESRFNVKQLKSVECDLSDLNLSNWTYESYNESQSDWNETVSIFKLLPNLTEINFSNRITELRSIDFEGAVNVVKMDLSNNNISYVETDAFSEFFELKYLDLKNNSIESIPEHLFLNNENIDILHLENNPLKHFYCGGLSLLHKITVYFSWNDFKPHQTNCGINKRFKMEIKNDIIFRYQNIEFRYAKEDFQKLRQFDISGYLLRNTPEIIEFLGHSLKELDLSINFIENINKNTFQKFYDLKFLNLSRTNLTIFKFDTLKYQTKLEILDVSHNQIEELDFKVNFLGSLVRFDVSGNRLRILSVNYDNFPLLKFLGIAQNEIHCGKLKAFSNKWSNLYFLHNHKAQRTYTEGIDCRNTSEMVENTTELFEIKENIDKNGTKIKNQTRIQKISMISVDLPNVGSQFDDRDNTKHNHLLKVMITLNILLSTVIIIAIIWFCVKKQKKRRQLIVNNATVRFRRREISTIQNVFTEENIYDEIEINR